jgi:uncharacterized membrane protein YfcA
MVGVWIVHRIPERIYRAFVLAVATIAAIMTLM